MTEIQNSKPVLVIWYWNLKFVCNLVLGVWDFIDSNTQYSSGIQNEGMSLKAPSEGNQNPGSVGLSMGGQVRWPLE